MSDEINNRVWLGPSVEGPVIEHIPASSYVGFQRKPKRPNPEPSPRGYDVHHLAQPLDLTKPALGTYDLPINSEPNLRKYRNNIELLGRDIPELEADRWKLSDLEPYRLKVIPGNYKRLAHLALALMQPPSRECAEG